MTTETLRLGVDPRPAQKGMREYKRALDEGASASKRLADTVESNARRETSVYQRAARERMQLERQLASRRTQTARVSAVAAAEAFVRGQEQFYQANIARIKLAQARGMMSPSEARAAGQQAAAEFNAAISGTLERRPQLAQNREAFTTLAGSIKNVGESGRSAGVGMHRLNNSLVVLARRATGAHPVVGQLVDVVGTFAIGTAKMVPILAGLAAIGGAFALLSREARESKKELEDNLEVLRKIAREREIEARGGETQVAVEAAQAEARRIAVLLRQAQITDRPSLVASYTEELREQNRLVAVGMRELADEAEEERAQERRDRHARRQEVEAAKKRNEEELIRIQEEADALKRKLKRQHWQVEDQFIANAQAERERQSQAFHDRIVAQVADTLERIDDERQERHDAEIERVRELERARERAMKNLVRGLFEVGRAFGGTTDQLLSMTAAILSLERLPGFREGETPSTEDRLVGYGSAALAGAGYGTSTGSPALGAVGGAISGGMMAGPAGAIVGGVSGIVTGLIEQGRRARAAAAQWEAAFRDFEVMFSDLTPTEQRQHTLDQVFGQRAREAAAAYGGPAWIDTIEEAQALLDKGIRSLPGGFTEAYIEALEQLVRQYGINSERLLGLTNSIDTLTGALNAPSGFRQSYYRWLAQGVIPDVDAPPLPPTGGGGGGGGGGPDRRRGGVVYEVNGPVTFHVQGTTNPKETAEEVVRTWEREMTRGGPGPLQLTAR